MNVAFQHSQVEKCMMAASKGLCFVQGGLSAATPPDSSQRHTAEVASELAMDFLWLLQVMLHAAICIRRVPYPVTC